MKIAVIGYSGSGKSTLAQALGERYGIPVLHLDAVHWLPGWQERNAEESRRLVQEFMENPQWVVDGNYTRFEYERRLREADQILFLNFPRLVCFFRAWKRYFRWRGRTRSDMGKGCPEKMDAEFMGWILWRSRTGKSRKKFHRAMGDYPEKVTVLRSQREINRYLEELPC